MFYTIYKITNQINGKFYTGSHKTKDLDDSYIGSGKYLIRAQHKYGIENFKKEILFIFNTAEEMYAKEAEIVNEDFLTTENTYNLKVGGFGGWDYVNNHIDLAEHIRRINSRRSYIEQKGIQPKAFALCTQRLKDEGVWFKSDRFLGKKRTDETKKLIGEINSKLQTGSGNSQYGTR